MTTIVILNTIFALLVVAGIAAVVHTAHGIADGRFTRREEQVEVLFVEDERLAA
jgi:tetrahydromethanopterin S-methyltransferase subunit E